MQIAFDHFKESMTSLRDVSGWTELGYDLEGINQQGHIIGIEVKGLKRSNTPVLTDNEYQAAKVFQHRYFLIVIKFDENWNHSKYVITSPAFENGIELIQQQVIRYQVNGYEKFPTK